MCTFLYDTKHNVHRFTLISHSLKIMMIESVLKATLLKHCSMIFFFFSKNLTTNKTSKCKSYYTSSFTVSRDSRHGNNLIYKRYQNPSNDRLSHLNGLVSTQSSADFLISWVLVLDCLCLGFKRQPVVIGKSR